MSEDQKAGETRYKLVYVSMNLDEFSVALTVHKLTKDKIKGNFNIQ